MATQTRPNPYGEVRGDLWQPLKGTSSRYRLVLLILASATVWGLFAWGYQLLHGIGVGNMLPAWVRMVCVGINPAVVTKLADRGSSQTIGLVTDVGLFLHRLVQNLQD